MFCANCGKTLKQGVNTCPHCGAPVGENRFDGNPYTAAQPRIAPGEAEKLVDQYRPYTRTIYTGMGEPEGDEINRTTYRPALDDEAESQNVESAEAASNEPAANEGDAESLFATEPEAASPESAQAQPAEADQAASEACDAPAEDIEIDPESIKVAPIEVEEAPGMSSEVKAILTGEKPAPERSMRNLLSGKLPFGRKQEEPLFDDAEAPAETGEATAGEETDFLSERPAHSRGGFDYAAIIKYVAIALIIIAVFVGGYLWIDYVIQQKNASPIDGVTKSLYEDGIAYVDKLVDPQYKTELTTLYTTDMVGFIAKLDENTAGINALAPASPRDYDSLFIQALQHVADNVGNALTLDGLNVSKLATATSEEKVKIDQDSNTRWTIVNNSVTALKEATTAAGLTAIVNSQVISTVVDEPEEIDVKPTYDSSKYTSLAKGMDSEAVKSLQQRLIDLGWLSDTADGKFGSKTQTAIKFFQQAANFDVDGVASPEMQALLFSDDAPRKVLPTATPAPTPTPAP